MAFYENYISLCNAAHKSPSAVASELGISSASVTGWGQGAKPRTATLRRVADYFGTTPEALLRDQRPVGDEALRLIPGYLQLTPENQQRTKEYVALLLGSQQKP